MDLHIKNELTGEYETVFEIGYFTLFRLLLNLERTVQYLFYKHLFSKKINIGKLKRHGCILLSLPSNEEEMSVFIKLKNKGKHISIRDDADFSLLTKFLLYPDQAYQTDKREFHVLKYKNGNLLRQGTMIKVKGKNDSTQFVFVTDRDMLGCSREMMYAVYGFLEKQQFKNRDHILRLLMEQFNADRNKKNVA